MPRTCINNCGREASKTGFFCKECGDRQKKLGLALIPTTITPESNLHYVRGVGWRRQR